MLIILSCVNLLSNILSIKRVCFLKYAAHVPGITGDEAHQTTAAMATAYPYIVIFPTKVGLASRCQVGVDANDIFEGALAIETIVCRRGWSTESPRSRSAIRRKSLVKYVTSMLPT